MIPVMMRTPSSSRPHAFGRSSNVWQYLDLVHDRNTPSTGEQALSAFSESSSGDESDETDSVKPKTRDIPHQETGVQNIHQTRTRSSKVAIENSIKHRRTSQSILSPSSGSLPDLHYPLSRQEESRKILAISTSSSSTLLSAGLRVVGGSNFNSVEILKRLHALGTSSSAPLLPSVSPANNGHTNESSGPILLQNSAQGSGLTQGTMPIIAAPGILPVGNPSVLVANIAVNVPILSDAEKLRNDFNSQASRLSYGCSVALELFNGHLMMVGSPDGQVRVQSLEKLQMPQVKGYKDRAIFTLLDLADVRSAGSIRYGDSVWLQLSVGAGDVSWEQGGVLGAKVREAPQLKALGLLNDDTIRNDVQAPSSVGYPIPVTAYLPKSRDDGDMQVDEIQSRLRNKSAKMLGKWIIRSAVCQRRKQKDNFVYNNDEVYLEQDWFYLGADSDAGVAILRQLPPAIAGKDIKPGEYVVERRGAWKLRLLDSSSGSAGLSLAQQQMERLLLRAKSQLKQSQRMRAGQKKVYGPNLRGGTGFTKQLRAQVAASTREIESRCADRQEWRLKRINRHMSEKARSMNVSIGFEENSELTSRPNSGLSGNTKLLGDPEMLQKKSSLRRNFSVDLGPKQSRHSISNVDKNGLIESGKTALSDVLNSGNPSCGLCHSSSIGYNLCCQFRHVIQLLEEERLDNVSRMDRINGTCSEITIAPGTRRTARSRVGRTARAEDAVTSLVTVRSSRESGSRDTLRSLTPQTAHNTGTQLNDRVLQLFAKEDAAMVGLIKYKEKEADRVMSADIQSRNSSPATTHFRGRFKHVGIFVKMHRQQQQTQQDGISGHFQKLHADLYSTNNPVNTVDNNDHDSNDEYEDSEDSTEEIIEPQETTKKPLVESRNLSDESISPETERLFPSLEELEHLTPVDTKAALVLYVQNRTAMAEMLDGYAELVETRMIPTLKDSLSTRNRGALVETLDFVARASEFVCARRVQVFVAKLLHAIAESDVGDFGHFQKEFDELVVEMQGAGNFIKFFLQSQASRRKNKNK